MPADSDPSAVTSPDQVRTELRRLWSSMVGSAADDAHLFRLGGTSLQALRLLAAIRARFGVTVGFSTLLEHATPAALADLIVQAAREASAEPSTAGGAGDRAAAAGPQPRPDPRRETAPVTVLQHDRLGKDQHYLERGAQPPPHHVRAALRLRGELDIRALSRALQQLPHQHPALRLVFEPAGSSWQQRLLPTAEAQLPLRQHDADEPDLPELLRELAGRRFDLAQGPPVRADLVRVADRDHVLLLTFEHLVTDGASVQLILEDLATCYRAGGVPGNLEKPALSFLDYAHAEAKWLTEHRGKPDLEHWRKAFHSVSGLPYCEIPLGSPVPPRTTSPVRVDSFRLAPALVGRLTKVAQQASASWFTLVSTAAQLAVGELTGREGIATISPVANRHRPGTERTVGWFANLVALTSNSAEREAAAGLLHTLRRRQLDALDNSEIPFWYVMEQLFGHDSRRQPDSSWIYVEVEPAPSADSPALTGWPGLQVRRVPVPTLIAGRGLYFHATVGPASVAMTVAGRQDRFSGEDLAKVRAAVSGAWESLGHHA